MRGHEGDSLHKRNFILETKVNTGIQSIETQIMQ